ncbi:uncharacterized protein LOC133325483 [Musca vetustissima]|uniref:uncharacterized protein LOC133325483 n=1 Tax=Musca vetustissima TaxID=27455 RepID=UPI002AB6E967|nr:uncharacterized protein LOC133325483 [Musca vetustissima]
MDGDSPKTKKFKEAMKKFRTHFERAESQRRRTIFIDDDDIPSTSRNAPRRCTKQRDRPPSLRGEDHIFFRMEETANNIADVRPTFPDTHGKNNEKRTERQGSPRPNDATVHPEVPRTPIYISCSESTQDSTDMSDINTPTTSIYSELPITPGKNVANYSDEQSTLPRPPMETSGESSVSDIDEDEWRNFYGYEDKNIEKKSPTAPPSPSSTESDEENYKCPSPKPRKGLGFIEQKDREYRYLGFRCYERTVTVKLLVPDQDKTPILAINGEEISKALSAEPSIYDQMPDLEPIIDSSETIAATQVTSDNDEEASRS